MGTFLIFLMQMVHLGLITQGIIMIIFHSIIDMMYFTDTNIAFTHKAVFCDRFQYMNAKSCYVSMKPGSINNAIQSSDDIISSQDIMYITCQCSMPINDDQYQFNFHYMQDSLYTTQRLFQSKVMLIFCDVNGELQELLRDEV